MVERGTTHAKAQMSDKLRVCSALAGTFALLFACWGVMVYENGFLFALVATIGGVMFVLPSLIQRIKLRNRRYQQHRGSGRHEDVIYVSSRPLEEPDDILVTLRERLSQHTEYTPTVERFSEGRGITIVHTGFHTSFVRISSDNHLVITSGKKHAQTIIGIIRPIVDTPFEISSSNPMLNMARITGGLRLVMYLMLIFLLTVSLTLGTQAAYSPDTYNPTERAALVSSDLHSSLSPSFSATDNRLQKAAYLSSFVDEESVEIYWKKNSTDSVIGDSRQAVEMTKEVHGILTRVNSTSLSSDQAEQVSQTHSRLQIAKHNVSRAIDTHIRVNDLNKSQARTLRSLNSNLQNSSNTTTTTIH